MIAKVKKIGKYNTAILKLFKIILNLNGTQQELLLKLAENLFIKEMRAKNRQLCHTRIYYATSDRVFSSHIENISPTGLFIKSEKPLATGEEILMTFTIKGFSKPFKVRGEIAYANDAGIGVKFKDLSPIVANKLENVVVEMQG